MTAWFDNHCHLGPDASEVVARAREAGVVGMVTVGCDLEDSRAALATASAYDCLLYTSPSPRDLSTSRMPSSA